MKIFTASGYGISGYYHWHVLCQCIIRFISSYLSCRIRTTRRLHDKTFQIYNEFSESITTVPPPVSLPPPSDLNLAATETTITASFQPDTSGVVDYYVLHVAPARTPKQRFITREIPVLQNFDRVLAILLHFAWQICLTTICLQVTLNDPNLIPGQTYTVTLSSRIRGRPGEDFNTMQKTTTLGT